MNSLLLTLLCIVLVSSAVSHPAPISTKDIRGGSSRVHSAITTGTVPDSVDFTQATRNSGKNIWCNKKRCCLQVNVWSKPNVRHVVVRKAMNKIKNQQPFSSAFSRGCISNRRNFKVHRAGRSNKFTVKFCCPTSPSRGPRPIVFRRIENIIQ